MKPLSLYLEGFKTFAEGQTIDFTEYPEDGLCFVTGENQVDPELGANGSGKSSLWDGLCVACFGKTSRGLKAGDIASWQVSHALADKAEIAVAAGKKVSKKATIPSVTTRLTFENYGGDVCTINRRWNPNVLTLQVGDGEPKNVEQSELDTMLGYNFDEFLQAAYFSQFQDLFLDMGSTERSALVAKVLNLNIWDKYSESAKKDADSQLEVIEEDRRALERLRGQIEELESLDLSEQIAEWDAAHQKELTKLEEGLQAHEAKGPDLTAAVEKAKAMVEEQTKVVDTIEAEQEDTVQLALKPLKAAMAEALQKIDDKLHALEDQGDQLDESATDDLRKEIRQLSREETQLEGTLKGLESDMDAKEAKAKKVEALEGDCSACGQPISAKHVDGELDKIDKDLEALEEEADTVERNLSKVRRTLKKQEKELEQQQDAQRAAARQRQDQLRALRADRRDTEKDYTDQLQDAEASARSGTRKALREAQQRFSDLSNEKAVAGNALHLWKVELTDLRGDLEDCEDEKNPHALQHEKNLKRLESLRTSREQGFEELEKKVEEEQSCRYWVRGFKSVKLYAVSNALNELEAEVNSALDGLGLGGWSVEFDVDKENKSGTLTKGFFAFINGPDNLEPVKWEAWSGGESQRLRLAASLGLANMIRASKGLELPFEIWDEPSQWMSDAGINGLLDVLQRRAKRLKRQIWLIDHRGLEHPFDGILKVTKTLEGSTIANVSNTFGGAA